MEASLDTVFVTLQDTTVLRQVDTCLLSASEKYTIFIYQIVFFALSSTYLMVPVNGRYQPCTAPRGLLARDTHTRTDDGYMLQRQRLLWTTLSAAKPRRVGRELEALPGAKQAAWQKAA